MKKHIPQSEFSFAVESFNLAGQTQEPVKSAAPLILAEVPAEVRAEAIARMNKRQQAANLFTNIGEAEVRREVRKMESETQPGLSPGSAWHKHKPDAAMSKALATMQRGGAL